MNWKFLKREDINVALWDQIVNDYGRGLPYTYSWYLDICCDNWEAAILGDYEAICALPFNRKKFGFKQLFTPFFVQQLGWISSKKLEKEKVLSLIHLIMKRYFFIHYAFNEKNLEIISLWKEYPKKLNLTIDLSPGYEAISNNYSKGLKYSIKKAGKEKIRIQQADVNKENWSLLKSHLLSKTSSLNSKDFNTIQTLVQYALKHEKALLFECRTQANEMLAVAFFLCTQKRIINLFQASTITGRNLNAISFLFDNLIQNHAGKDLIFDFEGSEIPGVQSFMKSFGAEEKYFPLLNKKW